MASQDGSRLTSSFHTETRRTSWSSTTSSTSSSTHRPQVLHREPARPSVTLSSSSASLSSSSSSWSSEDSEASSTQQLPPRVQPELSEETQHCRRFQQGAEQVQDRRGSGSLSETTAGGSSLHQLELKIEAKLKFSQFLDEVTNQVLKPTNLLALRRRSSSISIQEQDQLENKPLQLRMQETVGRTYLETDIDSVEMKEVKVKKETAITFQSTDKKEVMDPPEPAPGLLQNSRSVSRNPPRSTSLPRGINLVSL